MLRRHPIVAPLTVCYVIFIGFVTLTPAPFDHGVSGGIDRLLELLSRSSLTAWLTYDRLEFVANIGMFVPLGALLVFLLGRRAWWLSILCGIAYSVFIESFQGTVLSATRYATVQDVVANSAGAAVGVAIAMGMLVLRTRRRARREAARDAQPVV